MYFAKLFLSLNDFTSQMVEVLLKEISGIDFTEKEGTTFTG